MLVIEKPIETEIPIRALQPNSDLGRAFKTGGDGVSSRERARAGILGANFGPTNTQGAVSAHQDIERGIGWKVDCVY